MSCLIVPCIGRKLVNNIPQYLNRHPNGKLLIERSIEGVYSGEYDRVIVVVLRYDVDQFNVSTVICNELVDYPIEIIVLEEMTSGPAETIYKTLQLANITGSFVVKDADNYLVTKKVNQSNFVAGLDLNKWEQDIHNLRNKSFLIINEQGNLLDIIEKQVRSDVICLGLYGFKRTDDFILAYQHLNDGTYPVSKLYLSHIISYLIGYLGHVFHYVESIDYENWSDELHWKELQRNHTLFFVDIDNMFGENGELSSVNCDKFLILQSRGAVFIGYTVADKEYNNSVLTILQSSGINFLKIIYGCPYSECKEIIASEYELNNAITE